MSDLNGAPPPCVILDEFLVAQEWNSLLRFTFDRVDSFSPTGVLTADGSSSIDRSYRRSRVLFDLEGFAPVFVDRIMKFLPLVFQRLNHPWFPVRHVELQLTGTNNGEYFRVHSDNHSDPVRTRVLTFVYYFYREPKPFDGGALRLWNTQYDGDSPTTIGEPRVIPPMQNQIIFFPSDNLHEVMPVESPAGEFADSRFTVNGWLHR